MLVARDARHRLMASCQVGRAQVAGDNVEPLRKGRTGCPETSRQALPFPALPDDLLEAAPDSGGVLAFWPGSLNNFKSLQCEGRDLNPHGVTR